MKNNLGLTGILRFDSGQIRSGSSDSDPTALSGSGGAAAALATAGGGARR